MNKVKIILIAIGFLIPSLVVAALLTAMLAKLDYGPDPAVEVGTTLWGTWALLCGFYFKSKRFTLAGVALLIFVVLGLISGIA